MLSSQELYQQVSHLPPLEKLRLAELLLADLDTPNPEIDAIWREEAYILIEKDVRRCLVKRSPYGILYGISADKIIAIAVAHLHRKPDYWIDRA